MPFAVRMVDFGGTRIAFRSPAPDFLEAVESRYQAFLCAGEAFDFEVIHDPEEEAFRERYGWLSRIDAENRRAWIGSASVRGVEVLDGVIRMLLPSLVPPDLVLHGAMLDFDGEAVLCCGRPGAGKSTIASLFPKEACCDELCRLRFDGSAFEARSLPFWRARPLSLPLARIFVLEHGDEHSISALGASGAMREMRKHVYWPLEDEAGARAVFSTLTALVSKIPVFSLAFRPDVSVRGLLESPHGE